MYRWERKPQIITDSHRFIFWKQKIKYFIVFKICGNL